MTKPNQEPKDITPECGPCFEVTHATLHQLFVLVWQVKLKVCPRCQRKVGLNYMPVWTQSMFKYTVKRLLHINRYKTLKALYWMDRSKLTWDDPTVPIEAMHHGSGLLFNLKLQSTECKWDRMKAEINVLSTSLVWKVCLQLVRVQAVLSSALHNRPTWDKCLKAFFSHISLNLFIFNWRMIALKSCVGFCVCVCVCVCCSVVPYSLWPHGLQPTRLSIPGTLQARILEWIAIPFSSVGFYQISKWISHMSTGSNVTELKWSPGTKVFLV